MPDIIKSTSITLIISTGIAFALKEFLGFWECFVLATIVQFFLFFFVKSKTIQQTTSIIQELTNNLDTFIERQQVNVQCPCGKNTIPVVVFLDEEIVVECDKCMNTFRVITDIQTQLITEPVNMESIYNKLKEQQYNQV